MEFVEGIALFFKKQEECAALIRLYGRKRNPANTNDKHYIAKGSPNILGSPFIIRKG